MKALSLHLTIVILVVGVPLVGKAVDDSLVLFFPFEEGQGNTTGDKSGHNNTGTLEGNVKWVEGKYGGGLELTDRDSFVTVSDDATLGGMDELTIQLWLKLELIDSSTVVSKNEWNTSFHSHFGGDGGDVLWGYSGIPSDRLISPAGVVVQQEWTHLALQFDGPSKLWKIYKNGEEAASGPAGVEEIPDTATDLFIGGRPGRSDSFVGLIDEVAVYRRALTAEEIMLDMEGVATAVGSSDKLTTTWGHIKERNHKE